MSVQITEEELETVWEEHGMKNRYARLHHHLASHGLLPHITTDKYCVEMKKILKDFFIRGMREDKDGKQSFTNT